MDKTDNKTETKGDKTNRNKEGLPFTDSAIQEWLPGFSERGNPKFIEIPFNIIYYFFHFFLVPVVPVAPEDVFYRVFVCP